METGRLRDLLTLGDAAQDTAFEEKLEDVEVGKRLRCSGNRPFRLVFQVVLHPTSLCATLWKGRSPRYGAQIRSDEV